MFGLRNTSGSCWVNATLQALFRIPDLQKRFADGDEDANNPIETCLSEIWGSRGDEGLRDFYSAIKTVYMPAGEGIGDSHELFAALCDKIPFLDKLVRFKVAKVLECKNCKGKTTIPDTYIELSVTPMRRRQSVSESIVEMVTPSDIPDWNCDKCKVNGAGCMSQVLIGSFPRVLVFHSCSVAGSVAYTPVLNLNEHTYALFAVVCFTGGHWFTYGRDLPPGKPWHLLDDTNVQSYDPKHFPMADNMRLLMYYRINE
jgi:ubiquitin C-terminal hydrolase